MTYGKFRIFVGGIGTGVEREDVEREFGKFGKLSSVWVAQNPPGFAFVEFDDERDADEAVKKLNGQSVFDENKIRVEHSRERRGFRGRGGPGGPPGRGGRGGFRGGSSYGFSGSRDGGSSNGGSGGFRGYRGGGSRPPFGSSRGGGRFNDRSPRGREEGSFAGRSRFQEGSSSRGRGNFTSYRSRSPMNQGSRRDYHGGARDYSPHDQNSFKNAYPENYSMGRSDY